MVRYCGAEHLLRSGKLKIVWRHQDDPSVARTRTWNKFSISQFLLWKMSRFSGSELYRICQNLLEDFVWLKASEVFWYELILSNPSIGPLLLLLTIGVIKKQPLYDIGQHSWHLLWSNSVAMPDEPLWHIGINIIHWHLHQFSRTSKGYHNKNCVLTIASHILKNYTKKRWRSWIASQFLHWNRKLNERETQAIRSKESKRRKEVGLVWYQMEMRLPRFQPETNRVQDNFVEFSGIP